MGLIDREYMYEDKADSKKKKVKHMSKKERSNELWRLYGKKHKTIFDKLKIRKLENLNPLS